MTKAQEFLEKILASTPKGLVLTDVVPVGTNSIKVGQFYSLDDDVYILAQPSYKRCCLIALEGGNRWNEGIQVEDTYNITLDEFERIAPVGRYHIERININGR